MLEIQATWGHMYTCTLEPAQKHINPHTHATPVHVHGTLACTRITPAYTGTHTRTPTKAKPTAAVPQLLPPSESAL